MSESLLEVPKLENKMSESIAHVPCLQESVSFGRFDHDSLCWERWSTFPTNKYLEEVEKCSTPGSVAQKKAYFEAHYKKIAARKAELLDEEKKRESESMGLDDHSQNLMDSACTSCEEDLEVENSNIHIPVNVFEPEGRSVDYVEENGNNEHIDVSETSETVNIVEERNEESNFMDEVGNVDGSLDRGIDVVVEESQVANCTDEVSEDIYEPCSDIGNIEVNNELPSHIDDATEDLCSKKEPHESNIEQPDIIDGKTACVSVPQVKEELPKGKVVKQEMVRKGNKDALKLEGPKLMPKATSVRKTTISSSAKKQPTSPIPKKFAPSIPKKPAATTPKSPILSKPKSAKPVLSKSTTPTSRSLVKNEKGLTPPTSKKAKPETKRVHPTSLHMSISLGTPSSDPTALGTTRKSLIMERMGDKDIVKKAFKAFQNCNHLSPSLRSPATNQVLTTKTEQNSPSSVTLQKKTEGMLRSVKAASPVGGQQGMGKASLLPGPRKTTGVDQTKGKSISLSFGSGSLSLGNNPKEVSGKLEGKSKTEEASKIHLQSKAMLGKAAEIRRSSQSISPMTKLSSSCNQGRLSKVLLKG